MKTISKILILLVCILCFANPVIAGYEEQSCDANGACPDGWNPYVYEGECTCFTCSGDDCDAEEGAMKGCKPLPAKLHEANECVFCPLFKALYEAVRTISTEAFNATKDPIRNVMLYGFAIYIAFGVLKLVSSMTKQDAPKYISGLLVDTCKFVVAFLLLQSADSIYYYIINPLLSTSLDFGGAMLFSAGDAISSCKADSSAIGSGSSAILPDSLYASLECFIKGVQSEIAFVQAAGSSIMCVARHEGAGWMGIPDFSMLLSGLFIYVVALLLSIAFGFYLIDSVVMLGIIGALMTFFIACWPFKLTGGYTGKGFGMFMNVFFNFVFMGIVVSVNTQLIKASLATGGLENLEATLHNDNIKDAKEILDITGMGFLVIACCCFFGFKFTAKSASLASSMAGGGGIDIGARLGTILTSGAVNSTMAVGKSAVMPTVNKVWGGVKNAGNKALEVTGDAIFHPMKSSRKALGVMTKRYGQAQKIGGAAQGIIGNLKVDPDMVQKGKELYDKGKANQAEGQRRIDRENASLHPERQQSAPDYSNFDGNGGSDASGKPTSGNDKPQIDANKTGSSDTNTGDTPNNNPNPKAENGGGGQNTAHQNDSYTAGRNEYNATYGNKQPSSVEECDKLTEKAKQDFQYHNEEYHKNMNDVQNSVTDRTNALHEIMVAKNKMNTATNPTDINNAQMQYEQANQKFEAAVTKAQNSLKSADEHLAAGITCAMAYKKYQYAGNQMKQGASVDWERAHAKGEEYVFNTMDILRKAEPRNG